MSAKYPFRKSQARSLPNGDLQPPGDPHPMVQQADAQPTPEATEIKRLFEFMQLLKGVANRPPPAPDSTLKDDGTWAQQVVDALLNRLIRRVPKSGNKDRLADQCPFTGLNRGQLYELMKKRRNGRPVIQTISLREPGEAGGARFYFVGSVLDYLNQLSETQANEALSAVEKAP